MLLIVRPEEPVRNDKILIVGMLILRPDLRERGLGSQLLAPDLTQDEGEAARVPLGDLGRRQR